MGLKTKGDQAMKFKGIEVKGENARYMFHDAFSCKICGAGCNMESDCRYCIVPLLKWDGVRE